MARFNTATLEVKIFNEAVVISTLKRGLRSNRLIFFLNKNFSDTYDKIFDRVRKYAQVEEEEASLRQAKKDKNEKKRSRENDEAPQSKGPDPPRKNSRSRNPPQCFDSYTPLSTLQA